jgi:uncharacterized membrane protein
VTRFELFKLLHVLGAIVWLGAGASLFVLALRLRAAGDREGLLALGRHGQALGNLLFMPAALATLLFGVLMVATEARFAFTDLWILIGFGAIAASFAIALGFMTRADARLTALMQEHDIDHPVVAAQLTTVLRLNAVDVGILTVAVWAMVAKPTL